MKFFHLSDLHIGKRLNEFSLLEDQTYILNEILSLVDAEQPDGILIAGDVYDKSLPSAEAVTLLDHFLAALNEKGVAVFLISGNHDSPERLAFGSRILSRGGIHVSPLYQGEVAPITLYDGYGAVHLYLLPFLKPATVRAYADDEDRETIDSYTDALAYAIRRMAIDTSERNILLSHQFVTGATRSDSETVSVGGSDNVSEEVYQDFDYVALGHIHAPQAIGRDTLRYSGTPLSYSFSETEEKSVTVVELLEKGNVTLRTLPLIPLRRMVTLRGSYDELMHRDFYRGTTLQEDYVRVILTDEEDVFDAVGKLRQVYHNLMTIEYDNTRTRSGQTVTLTEESESLSPLAIFEKLYELLNNTSLTEDMREHLEKAIEDIWEETV
ncbi:MAG: exonuclease SbcCD subunit D [Clostridia bacterium]|nr:exonuclease SbcCD subunit D [Clostridia bacterium]